VLRDEAQKSSLRNIQLDRVVHVPMWADPWRGNPPIDFFDHGRGVM